VIEEGGYGADAAAPVVARAFNYLVAHPHWPGEAEARLDHASFYDHDQTLHDDDHARLEHHDEPNFDHDDDPEIGQIAGRRVAASNLMTLGVSVQNVQCANRTQQLRGAVVPRSCKH